MQDLKLTSLKSHDCHVLIQQFLLVAICGILPKNGRFSITWLCSFFNFICNKVIDPQNLEELQKKIVIVLCHLD